MCDSVYPSVLYVLAKMCVCVCGYVRACVCVCIYCVVCGSLASVYDCKDYHHAAVWL